MYLRKVGFSHEKNGGSFPSQRRVYKHGCQDNGQTFP